MQRRLLTALVSSLPLAGCGAHAFNRGPELPVTRAVLYQNGIGSLAWNDSWNLFDQTLLSPALVTGAGGKYQYYGARVHNKPYLQQPDGNFKGYPFRIYVGDTFTGGYSDHFAVFVILVKDAS